MRDRVHDLTRRVHDLPTLPASGHDWMYPHRWQRRGHPVTLFPTSDYNELERALRLLRVVALMRQTRIVLFPPAPAPAKK